MPMFRYTPNFPNVDAFGRLRIGTPVTLFESKTLVDAAALVWDDAETSGAGTSTTFNTNQASVTLAVSASTAGTRVRQSFRRMNYQPGKSQFVILSNVMTAAQAGITQRWGYFDADNGVGFQQTSAGLGTFIRTKTSGSVVTTPTARADWNFDAFDGAGPSGITLDVTKTTIWWMDLEWLGVGVVRYGIIHNGLMHLGHVGNQDTSLSLVYISTPNLPLRSEVSNDGSGGVASLSTICSSVIAEGGTAVQGMTRGLARTTALTTLNDADFYPLISVRLKSTHLGAAVQFTQLSVLLTTTATFAWRLVLNGTIAGTALAWTNLENSALQHDSVATNASKISGGTVLNAGVGAADVNNSIVQTVTSPTGFFLGAKIDNTPDILTLAVSRLTGTTEAFYGTLNWLEVI